MIDYKCPYCKSILIEGWIYGDRYSIKWLPKDKKLFAGIWAIGGEVISSSAIFSRSKTKSYKCEKCNKIIIDLFDK